MTRPSLRTRRATGGIGWARPATAIRAGAFAAAIGHLSTDVTDIPSAVTFDANAFAALGDVLLI